MTEWDVMTVPTGDGVCAGVSITEYLKLGVLELQKHVVL